MSEQPSPKHPYQTLGTHLKYLREQAKQSVAEVSGSVEIDESMLERIEAGTECPSEDILLLLINHFNMQDQEANQLWELAGYDSPAEEKVRTAVEEALQGNGQKSLVMLLAHDTRTVYTDSTDIACTPAGLTITFSQQASHGKASPVARLGMSYEQAEQVAKSLQTALLQAKYLRGPKALPPSIDSEEAS